MQTSTTKTPSSMRHTPISMGRLFRLCSGLSWVDAPLRHEHHSLFSTTTKLRLGLVAAVMLAACDATPTQTATTTALHQAVSEGNAALAKQLLDEEAPPNAKDAGGRVPLHFANDEAVASLLLEAGANPNAVNGEGETSLHLAANAAIESCFLTAARARTPEIMMAIRRCTSRRTQRL